MHYAEWTEEEKQALREAIRQYEAEKWKTIGQRLNKPAKVCEPHLLDSKVHMRRDNTDFDVSQACEQYAKEHFKN